MNLTTSMNLFCMHVQFTADLASCMIREVLNLARRRNPVNIVISTFIQIRSIDRWKIYQEVVGIINLLATVLHMVPKKQKGVLICFMMSF